MKLSAADRVFPANSTRSLVEMKPLLAFSSLTVGGLVPKLCEVDAEVVMMRLLAGMADAPPDL